MAVLLTGATGFVGMEVLARYLERTYDPVFVAVRARSDNITSAAHGELLQPFCGALIRTSRLVSVRFLGSRS